MRVYLRNKFVSWGGDSVVKNEFGNQLYKVKGRVFSLTRVKEITDMNDVVLYRVNNRFFNFFVHSAYICDAHGNRIAKVSDKWFNFNKEYILSGYKDDIYTEGDVVSLSCRIHKNGRVIGTIRRCINFVDEFEIDADTSNMPFIIAFVVAIDNIQDNKRN